MQTGKKRISIFLILLFLVAAPYAYSQENFLPGYVIELDGDTIKGLIDYRNWGKNPEKISFQQAGGEERLYTPSQIQGFGVEDELYLSAVVDTEISPLQSGKILPEPQLRLKTDTAFLQTMISGPKSLYYYMDKDGKEHFYIGKDGAFTLLIYKKYSEQVDGGKVIKEIREYTSQLREYLSDCPDLTSETKNADYRKGSLEKVLLAYYDCTAEEMDFQKTSEKIRVEFGALAGVSSTSLNFKSDNFTALVNTEYPASTSFAGGLSFDVIFPRNRGKWSLNNELLFSTYRVSGRYEDIQSEEQYTITTTEIGFAYLKLNNMIRYNHPFPDFFLFFNAGVSNGFAIGKTNEMVRESRLFSQIRTEEGEAIEDPRKLEQGLLLGLGGKWNRYSAELRYESGNGMSNFSGLSSPTNRFFFLLGYRF